MEERQPAVYILSSCCNGTLYIGVTSDLIERVWQHKHDVVPGFTHRYRIHRLVYFELWNSISDATEREMQLKKWRRAWKVQLIESVNPEWRDLWQEIL